MGSTSRRARRTSSCGNAAPRRALHGHVHAVLDHSLAVLEDGECGAMALLREMMRLQLSMLASMQRSWLQPDGISYSAAMNGELKVALVLRSAL